MIRPLCLALALAGLTACGQQTAAPEATTPAPAEPAAAPAAATPPKLIPRTVLYGNPVRSGGEISPDGKWLAWIAPRGEVMNVFVAPADKPDDARPVTNDTVRGIRGFTFAHDGKHLLYPQDTGGDENFRIHAVNLDSGDERVLTPEGARATFAGISADHPDALVVAVNDRDPKLMDLVRITLSTGEQERILENDGYVRFVLDDQLVPRLATRQTPDGGYQVFKADNGAWTLWQTVGQEDALTTNALGYTRDGKTLYVLDSRDRDTGALFAIDTATEERTLVFENAKADVSRMMGDPLTGKVQAVAANHLRNEWTVLDESIKADLDHLARELPDGEINVTSRTQDDRHWIIALTAADAGVRYYRYARDGRQLQHWFDSRPDLNDYTLAPMQALEIPARDGLSLVSYLTLPVASDPQRSGRPNAPVPLVLSVHGGPWARDAYGFSARHQWLANRGYAVLSVNFRGSTGFGKNFVNAGDLEWGKKMHDDLIDAVDWAIKNGITSADKVAIMGGSYGGYATLAGLTFTPDTFACGVDIVGPSNLFTLLESIPPYWAPMVAQFHSRMGNPNTEEGKALLLERSPLTHVANIKKPLLIGQGANDPRVKQAESDQIVAAMQERNIPVTYVLYPDEGHGFNRPPNNLSFNAVTESFLGRCLGGQVEPIGDAFNGASIQVPHGAQFLPGLPEALSAHAGSGQ